MKLSRNILLILLSFIICFWAFFSGVDVSTYLVLTLFAVFVAAAIISENGKLIVKRSYILFVLNWAIMFLYANRFTPGVIAYNLLFLLFSVSIIVFTNKPRNFNENYIIKYIVGFSFFTCGVILTEILSGNRIRPLFSYILSGEALTTELAALHAGHGYSGFANGVNVVSFATAIVLTYTVFLLKRKTVVKFAVIVLDLIVILFIGERSNILVIPLSIMISYYFISNKGKFSRGLKIIFVILLLIAAFIIVSPYLVKFQSINRIVWTIEMFISGNDVMNGRSRTYTQAISLWKESPVFGHGWFYFYNNNYGILKRETFSHVHNMLLELLCDCGIIGTIVIIAPRVYFYILNLKALSRASTEMKGKFAFTLAVQTFFYLDSMLHVTFYSIYISAIFYLILIYFMMLQNNMLQKELLDKEYN